MAKLCNDVLLQPNPFLTYRDPETGRWQVVPANREKLCDRLSLALEGRTNSAWAGVSAGSSF